MPKSKDNAILPPTKEKQKKVSKLTPQLLPTTHKQPDLSNLTPYEVAAVTIKYNNPEMTKGQIGRKLKELGLSKSKHYIYNRLGKNTYFSAELNAVENAHRETMIRSTYPLAEKVVERALSCSDKKLDLKGKLGYAKLTYDKVHGETHKHVGAPTIHIENVERLQAVIGTDLGVAQGNVKEVK